MPTSAEQIRAYRGPALFSYGFRPFFLFGALWAAFAMAVWLPMLRGSLRLPTALYPIQWHVHELIYGYVPAIVAGFLLTAIPNWTGRLPVTGRPLATLFALWVFGRVAILCSEVIGPVVAAVVDLLFLGTLASIITREIIAGKNARNFKVLAIIGVLLAGNITFHVEAMNAHPATNGMRIGIAAILLLIMLIGGRIIPSFTRNWLVRRDPGRLPRPFDRFDQISLSTAGTALALWIAWPNATLTAWLCLIAGGLHARRLSRWAGERTGAEPLVVVLHLGYAFVPAGFVLLALANLRPDLLSASAAMHAWTAGATGTMTLAVMTRASLGHSGQPLTATRGVQAIYAAVVLSALTRIAAGLGIARVDLLQISAATWVFAFVGFAFVFGPLLARPRTAQS
jgi:uncharacterized protein involved in response to NO